VVAKLFLQQFLQDAPSQGMKHIWPGMTRPHTSADNAMEKDGCVKATGMLAPRPGFAALTKKASFSFGADDFSFSLELPPKICFLEISGLGIFFNKLSNYTDYRKCRCCQPAQTYCKQQSEASQCVIYNLQAVM